MTNRIKTTLFAITLATVALAPLSGHCFYNPSTGRWLSRDPKEERGGPNLFVFDSNDPLNRLDPLGLDFVSSIELAPRLFNQDLGGPLGATWVSVWELRTQTAPCGSGMERMIDYRLHAVINEAFAMSINDASKPIGGQSTLDHENAHAIVNKKRFQTITDGARLFYGRCLCYTCFGAWEDWWDMLRHFVFDRARLESDLIDYNDPQWPEGQKPISQARLEDDRAKADMTQSLLIAKAATVAQACKK